VFSVVNLHDSLKFALTENPAIKILSNNPGLVTQDNLIYRVLSKLKNLSGARVGVEVTLTKRIPIAAGLGGGSSNAAMTILAANALFDLQMNDSEMHILAAEFGSDVNFFLVGGTCLGTGRGEKIYPIEDFIASNVLLVKPDFGIMSKEAYDLLGCGISNYQGDKQWYNVFSSVISTRYPIIEDILNELVDCGADKAMLSGSGSTCYGVFLNAEDCCKAKSHFAAKKLWTQKVRTIGRSEYQACFPSLN